MSEERVLKTAVLWALSDAIRDKFPGWPGAFNAEADPFIRFANDVLSKLYSGDERKGMKDLKKSFQFNQDAPEQWYMWTGVIGKKNMTSKVEKAAEEFIASRIPVGRKKEDLGIFLPIYEQTWEACARWLLAEAEKMQQNILPAVAFGPNLAFTPFRAVCLDDLRKLFEDKKDD